MQENGELIIIQSYQAETCLDIELGGFNKSPVEIDSLIT